MVPTIKDNCCKSSRPDTAPQHIRRESAAIRNTPPIAAPSHAAAEATSAGAGPNATAVAANVAAHEMKTTEVQATVANSVAAPLGDARPAVGGTTTRRGYVRRLLLNAMLQARSEKRKRVSAPVWVA